MGIIVGAGFIGIMMMTAGFFRLLPDLPKPLWRYPLSYVNYMSWVLQGAYKNDMIGMEFDPVEAGEPKLKGEFLLKNVLGISLTTSQQETFIQESTKFSLKKALTCSFLIFPRGSSFSPSLVVCEYLNWFPRCLRICNWLPMNHNVGQSFSRCAQKLRPSEIRGGVDPSMGNIRTHATYAI